MAIKVSIDVTKLDKAFFFTGKNGGKYVDLILWESTNDKFGNDFSVKQGFPKEVTEKHKAAGVKIPFVGNAKWMGQKPNAPKYDDNKPYHSPDSPSTPDEDVPF
jgi:hypothetical protein